jgi:hypothetical protein
MTKLVNSFGIILFFSFFILLHGCTAERDNDHLLYNAVNEENELYEQAYPKSNGFDSIDSIYEKNEPEPPATQAMDSQTAVDLRLLIGSNLENVRPFLGEETHSSEGFLHYRYYNFDTGIRVTVCEEMNILSVLVEYGDDNKTRYHFDGLNGEFTYDDVVAFFGKILYIVREGMDEFMVGAEKSYGYWVGAHEFLYVFFNSGGEVVALSYFLAERPGDEP